MKNTKNTILLIFLFSLSIQAQDPKLACGSDEFHAEQAHSDTTYKRAYEEINQIIYRKTLSDNDAKQLKKTSSCDNATPEEIHTLPIVIHLVHFPEDEIGVGTNFSDAKIYAAIDLLNQGFRNTGYFEGGPFNSNMVDYGIESVDVGIHFELAKRDPMGNPTNGINRIASPYSDFYRNEIIPDLEITQWQYFRQQMWEPSNYINVFAMRSICYTSTDGDCTQYVGGFANYPPGHSIFVGNYAVNDYPDGTLIHELGHYFGLRHTFVGNGLNGTGGDCSNDDCLLDGDRVCDTPPDLVGVSAGCWSSVNSCSTDADDTSPNNPYTSDVEDNSENYMDYSSCENTFTPGQRERMRYSLLVSRSGLLVPDAHVPVTPLDVGLFSSDFLSLTACESVSIPAIIKNYGTNTLVNTDIIVEVNNNIELVYNWNGNLQKDSIEHIDILPVPLTLGYNDIKIYPDNSNGTAGADGYVYNDTLSYCIERIVLSDDSVCESFDGITGTPPYWQGDFESDAWEVRQGDYGCSANNSDALVFDPRSSYSQTKEYSFYLPFTDMVSSSGTGLKLKFDRAYASPYSLSWGTELFVEISTDCGQNYTLLKYYDNDSLITVINDFIWGMDWTPDTCEDWVQEEISLNTYQNQTAIMRFRAVFIGYIEPLYIDNVCIEECNINDTGEIIDVDCAGNSTGAISMDTAYLNLDNISYNWSNGDSEAQIENIPAGIYTVSISAADCETTVTEFVVNEPTYVAAQISTTPLTCYASNDGTISINAFGGVPPYVYSLDGETYTPYPELFQLSDGTHEVYIQDATGCVETETADIDAPPELIIDIIENTNIYFGDSIVLQTSLNQVVDATYTWSSIGDLSCTGCPNPTVAPHHQTIYNLDVVTDDGCRASAGVTIFVDKNELVFIPNAFTPNSDRVNDVFMIHGNAAIIQNIPIFRIFDRWGDLLFENQNTVPNNPETGWDGLSRGQKLPSGVYIYYAEIQFIDGTTVPYSGDFTLIR